MLLRIPLLGLFRVEPLRDLWRIWLWLTAPEASRRVGWSSIEAQPVQLRSMTDGDLFVYYHGEHCSLGDSIDVQRELARRGWHVTIDTPQWIKAMADGPQETMALAEKLFRPCSKRLTIPATPSET